MGVRYARVGWNAGHGIDQNTLCLDLRCAWVSNPEPQQNGRRGRPAVAGSAGSETRAQRVPLAQRVARRALHRSSQRERLGDFTVPRAAAPPRPRLPGRPGNRKLVALVLEWKPFFYNWWIVLNNRERRCSRLD